MSTTRTWACSIAARLAVAAICAGVVVVGAPTTAVADTESFYPEQQLSKGWFGVLTYKFIRDEVPGGQQVLQSCSASNRFDDLDDESQFKRDALNCLSDLGYFDAVPAPGGQADGRRFYPEQRLSKGWFGVLTYKFVRDEIPGGRDTMRSCRAGTAFGDLSAASQFKRNALSCLAGMGYFDSVPLPDGTLPRWANPNSGAPDPDTRPANCTFDASQAMRSVWRVETDSGVGTAFYLGGQQWLTAAHVVQNSSAVTLSADGKTKQASILGGSIETDMALLEASGSGVPSLQFADMSTVAPGDTVYAVGFPTGHTGQPSLTRGIVSRTQQDDNLGLLIFTDAAVSPGNSGGPLLDACGKAIGMVVAKLVHVDIEGISYAIAASTLQGRLPGIETGGPSSVIAGRTWEQCFGTSTGDRDWETVMYEVGSGGWWHYSSRHKTDGTMYASAGIEAHRFQRTDRHGDVPADCEHHRPYISMACWSTGEFLVEVWWGGLHLRRDDGADVIVEWQDPDLAPRTETWSAWDNDTSYTTGVQAASLYQRLRRRDASTLTFTGFDNQGRQALQAVFEMAGGLDAGRHLRDTCGWADLNPPTMSTPLSGPSDWLFGDEITDTGNRLISAYAAGSADNSTYKLVSVLLGCFPDPPPWFRVSFGLPKSSFLEPQGGYFIEYKFGRFGLPVQATVVQSVALGDTFHFADPWDEQLFVSFLRSDTTGLLYVTLYSVPYSWSTHGDYESGGGIWIRGTAQHVEPVVSACGY